jgi:hypothetical protein
MKSEKHAQTLFFILLNFYSWKIEKTHPHLHFLGGRAIHLGVSQNAGTPKFGWFIMEDSWKISRTHG